MKYLLEESIREISSEKGAELFFKELCNADQWLLSYGTETNVFPLDVEGGAMGIDILRKDKNIPAEIMDESIVEALGNTVLGITLSNGLSYPIGSTAYGSLMTMSGFPNATALTYRPNKSEDVLPNASERAFCFNLGLSGYADKKKLLFLVRDEKVRGVLSGNESDYSVLRFDELMKELKKGLKKFDDVQFVNATASYEYSTVEYTCEDPALLRRIADVFNQSGVGFSNPKMDVQLISSDIGISGANIYPFVRDGKTLRMIGKPVGLTHKNKHTVKDFAANVQLIYSMFKDAADKLEVMQTVRIKHPAGCLLRLAKHIGLSKQMACEEAPKFETMYGNNTYQIDVYWKLYEILDDMIAKNNMSQSRQLQLQEQICQIAFSEMADYDLPFQWD